MAEIAAARSLLDEIKEFTDLKWKQSECERCGVESWLIYPDEIAYIRLTVAGKESFPNVTPQPSRGAIPLTCLNCGNIRLIDTEVFERWRGERKGTK
jgi:hypothetical protein